MVGSSYNDYSCRGMLRLMVKEVYDSQSKQGLLKVFVDQVSFRSEVTDGVMNVPCLFTSLIFVTSHTFQQGS